MQPRRITASPAWQVGKTRVIYESVIRQTDHRTVFEQLEPEIRVRILSMLFGIIVIGVGLIFLVWIGARIVRRYTGISPIESTSENHAPNDDDWWKKPLVTAEDEELTE